MQLMQMFQFQMQQISTLLNTVQNLLANAARPMEQAPPTATSTAIPPLRLFREQVEEWLKWLSQFEAHILAHHVPDSWIQRAVWPQAAARECHHDNSGRPHGDGAFPSSRPTDGGWTHPHHSSCHLHLVHGLRRWTCTLLIVFRGTFPPEQMPDGGIRPEA
ncbi:uncharacterized protein LOC126260901 [Schistocerca nitens]|uniref:uncharacterized protein LOC126260901 n=1 Tax=Schistocerca nitens TaxID=7011 RepID=UPI0021180401|nr:uncharacterized protein LOC126260901 [Schistocerca nitens]